MKISLVSVLVNDPIKAFKFYTEVLGCVEKMYMPEAHLAIVAAPGDPDGTQILLELNEHPVAKPYHEGIYKEGLPVIIFEVNDIQKEFKRLNDLGVKFSKEPTKVDWGTEAIFDDTCGNFIQIYQK
jgi:predicted enzyme related to lactoylglutathione lyase